MFIDLLTKALEVISVKRLISAIVIGALFITGIVWFEYLFYLLILLAIFLGHKEWSELTKEHYVRHLFIPLILPGFVSLLILRGIFDYKYTLIYFLHIWCVDILAMLTGKIIEGPKLCPTISPKKTISGFIFGITFAAIIASFLDNMFNILQLHSLFSYYCFMGVIAQVSDLLLSAFKRKFNQKDFSQTIPGHGGILDRFDSIILTAPLYLLLLSFGVII